MVGRQQHFLIVAAGITRRFNTRHGYDGALAWPLGAWRL
jgi:hypothetical protein